MKGQTGQAEAESRRAAPASRRKKAKPAAKMAAKPKAKAAPAAKKPVTKKAAVARPASGRVVPSKTAPAKTTPAKAKPAKTTPVKATQAHTTPAQTTLAQVTLAQTTLAQTTLAQTTPAQTTPAHTTLGKAAPGKTAPAKTAPAKTAPTRMPAGKTTPGTAVPGEMTSRAAGARKPLAATTALPKEADVKLRAAPVLVAPSDDEISLPAPFDTAPSRPVAVTSATVPQDEEEEEAIASPEPVAAEPAVARPAVAPSVRTRPDGLVNGASAVAMRAEDPVSEVADAEAPAAEPVRGPAVVVPLDRRRLPGGDRPPMPVRPPSKAEDFAEGDHVVYPTHGVGKVERIAVEDIAGHRLELIHITFEENRMTLRVPVAKARSAGLRKLATRKSFDEALAVLKGRARIKRTMWSRRAQEYEAKINSGDPMAIAEVVRDLHRNAGQPDQSFSERQIYEAAMDRLAAELGALDRTDKATAASKLADFLKTLPT